MQRSFLALALGFYMFSPTVQASEFAIGEAKIINGMKVAAVYLQAVTMHPEMQQQEAVDIHLEADISAAKNNPHGFQEGAWMPYLTISYQIHKKGSDWHTAGALLAMVANDGPHYGKNIKLAGAGEYTVSFHIEPPIKQGFYRHTDRETGVAPWWQSFEVSWSFKYMGVGKKGGY